MGRGGLECELWLTLAITLKEAGMNVLIIGSGGREHALGWKLKQSKQCGKLFFAPGNGGTATLGQNVDLTVEPVNTKHADEIDWFCRENKIELVVIGKRREGRGRRRPPTRDANAYLSGISWHGRPIREGCVESDQTFF